MNEGLGILWFVLNEDSRERLRKALPPLYKNEFYHHITLRYGVTQDEVASFINKQWKVRAYSVAHNKDAQACRVETDGLPDEYGVPHITLSTADGIKPFASVAMLQGEHDETPLDPLIEVSGTVGFEYLDQIKD